jgi:hypothetical protein
MPESVNYWTSIPSPAGQLFHADPQHATTSGKRFEQSADVFSCWNDCFWHRTPVRGGAAIPSAM